MKEKIRKDKDGNKVKVVYEEDKGETIYSMSALYGMTPEEMDKFAEDKKKAVKFTRKEKRAARRAVYSVYGPMFICMILGFSLVAVILFLIMKL